MTYKAKPLPPVDLPKLHIAGKPLRRVDALGKTTGTTVYAADFTMPGTLHAKVLRSTEPSARIVRLDITRASALPGVACVLTAEDLPDGKLTTDMPGQTGQKQRARTDAPVLASDVVRFVGEPIALVAAETPAIAEEALNRIEVEYEPLPAVFDPIEAMKPGAPVVTAPDNIVARWKIRKGDVEKGMADADTIVENTYRVPYIEHAYLEPEAGLAWIDDQNIINIRVSTQVIEHFRSIARAIGVPQNRIHIEGTLLGGGFGGKEDVTVEIFLALLAQRTRRPVRLVYTREESFIAHCKRHPFIITHRTGVTKDGRITAAQIEIISNSGAYPYLSPYVLLYATVTSTGPYRVENLQVDSVSVATNNPFSSAFRGFGGAQAAVAYEQQMDEIANALGMDRLDVRRANYLRTGDRNASNQQIQSAAWLEETATRALEALGDKSPADGPVVVGQGFASYLQSYGRITWFHDTSRAWVGLELDGTATIRCGVPDLGGGQRNSLCQIAAEVLGLSLDDIAVYSTDSAVTPLAGTTTATRQLYMSGNATLKAARAIRDVVVGQAAVELNVSPEEIDLADGKAFLRSDPSTSLPISEVAGKCAAAGLPLYNHALFTAPFSEMVDPENVCGDIYPDFTFGAQAVEVAVDTETGEVTLRKSVACHDIGRCINRAAVEGQIHGGSAQGLGYALMEDFKVREGHTETPSFAEYLIPTASDFPTTQAIILESGTGLGPFGAKGIGEPSLTPAAPAVANAVADALGVRIRELPLTPERVLRALGKVVE